MSLKEWKQIDCQVVVKNHHWQYNLDRFITDDGVEGEYHYLHTLGSTMIIPVRIDPASFNKQILFVKQYRYLNKRTSIEFPCGAIEKGLSKEENASKELREETGFGAEALCYIGKFSPYTGVSDEFTYLYIAENLFLSPLSPDQFEEFELLWLSPDQINKYIEDNIIWDGLTLAAWALAQNKFYRKGE